MTCPPALGPPAQVWMWTLFVTGIALTFVGVALISVGKEEERRATVASGQTTERQRPRRRPLSAQRARKPTVARLCCRGSVVRSSLEGRRFGGVEVRRRGRHNLHDAAVADAAVADAAWPMLLGRCGLADAAWPMLPG